MKIIFDSEEQKKSFFYALDNHNPHTVLCPREFGFISLCEGPCSDCWKEHIDITVRDYKKQAEKMISDGTVVKSRFYDILVNELARQLEEDDNKKVVK